MHHPASIAVPVQRIVATPTVGNNRGPRLHGITHERDQAIEKQKNSRERWKEEKYCETLEDWQELARQRGYKVGWAYFRYKQRIMKKSKKVA